MVSHTGSRKKTNRDLLADERRQQILDIARKQFAEKGYHGTSMRELNKAIGMAEALTYHYFPGGKQAILQAVLQNVQEQRMANIVTSFENTFNDDVPLKEILRSAIHRLDQRFVDDKEYFQILLQDRNLIDQEQLASLNRSAEQPSAAFVGLLKQRVELGEIREMDVEMAASQFISHAAIGAFQHILFDKKRDAAQIERMIDFYVTMWSK